MLDIAHLMRWLGPLALLAGLAAAAQTPSTAPEAKTAVATFAGGCFWCVEEAFEKVPGVLSAVSGYTGGTVPNPTYEQVSKEATGHAEAVRVNIDPSQAGGQFCDHGSSYRSAIFVHHEAQRKVAEDTKRALEASGRIKQAIVTEIVAAGAFYEAEDYHQDYYKKNPNRYRFYKFNCGRVQRLEEIWGKATPPPNL